MVNRLIKTEKDYNEALSHIEGLMNAEENTAEADELELLSTLVELYEEKRYPITPPDPVDAIRFRMEQLGLSQKDLISFIGSRGRVSEILHRKRTLTLSMMRSLHRNLGIPAEVLLQEPGGTFPEDIPNLAWNKFPVAEMAARCWLPNGKNLEEHAEELMRDFAEQAGGWDAIQAVAFRRSMHQRLTKKTDPYALIAWCLRVCFLARKNPLKNRYAKGIINLQFMRETVRLSCLSGGPVLAKEYLEKNGIHLVIVPHLPRTYLDGAAIRLPDGTPVIGMTLRHDRLDNFWFCLLHELAHIAKHLTSSDSIIVDDLDLRRDDVRTESTIESEADEMAMEASIPKKVWNNELIQEKSPASQVIALAGKLRIHPAIIAGRIRHERKHYRLLSQLVGSGEVRDHFPEYGAC